MITTWAQPHAYEALDDYLQRSVVSRASRAQMVGYFPTILISFRIRALLERRLQCNTLGVRIARVAGFGDGRTTATTSNGINTLLAFGDGGSTTFIGFFLRRCASA